jgi:hypothetical protein
MKKISGYGYIYYTLRVMEKIIVYLAFARPFNLSKLSNIRLDVNL